MSTGGILASQASGRQPAMDALPPVLAEILERGAVRLGDSWIDLHSHVSLADGLFLQQLVRSAQARRSLEVGMAYGISTLFLCDALSHETDQPLHIAIDPFQNTDWRGVGLANATRAGFRKLIEFHEAPSEFVLPSLVAAGKQIDIALVDGWHSFDQALVEFFYVDRMLKVGGIVAFDDADWPAIDRLLRFIISLPAYEVFAPERGSLKPTPLGRLRQRLGGLALGKRILNPSFRRRRWDLGIQQRLVAVRKVRDNTRDMRHFEDF